MGICFQTFVWERYIYKCVINRLAENARYNQHMKGKIVISHVSAKT